MRTVMRAITSTTTTPADLSSPSRAFRKAGSLTTAFFSSSSSNCSGSLATLRRLQQPAWSASPLPPKPAPSRAVSGPMVEPPHALRRFASRVSSVVPEASLANRRIRVELPKPRFALPKPRLVVDTARGGMRRVPARRPVFPSLAGLLGVCTGLADSPGATLACPAPSTAGGFHALEEAAISASACVSSVRSCWLPAGECPGVLPSADGPPPPPDRDDAAPGRRRAAAACAESGRTTALPSRPGLLSPLDATITGDPGTGLLPNQATLRPGPALPWTDEDAATGALMDMPCLAEGGRMPAAYAASSDWPSDSCLASMRALATALRDSRMRRPISASDGTRRPLTCTEPEQMDRSSLASALPIAEWRLTWYP
mmetsp:Transcript_2176/g.8396  ORF Transcript_2176/g.8396 Transcript_2176/m.8396 type:complete len:371 (-) Transcript_2176:372-1484(-)